MLPQSAPKLGREEFPIRLCVTANEPFEASQRCAYLGITLYLSNSLFSGAILREVHTAARKVAPYVAGEEKVPRFINADSQKGTVPRSLGSALGASCGL